jgi:hypothetical protein
MDNDMTTGWAKWANEYEQRQRIFMLVSIYQQSSRAIVKGNWKRIDSGRTMRFVANDPIYTEDIGWDVFLAVQYNVWKL